MTTMGERCQIYASISVQAAPSGFLRHGGRSCYAVKRAIRSMRRSALVC